MLKQVVFAVAAGLALSTAAQAKVYSLPEVNELVFEWNGDTAINAGKWETSYNLTTLEGTLFNRDATFSRSDIPNVSTSSSYPNLPSNAYRFRGTNTGTPYVGGATPVTDVADMSHWVTNSSGTWLFQGSLGKSSAGYDDQPLGKLAPAHDDLATSATFEMWIKPNAASLGAIGSDLYTEAQSNSKAYATQVLLESGANTTSGTNVGFHIGLRQNGTSGDVEVVVFSPGGGAPWNTAASQGSLVYTLTDANDSALLDDYINITVVNDAYAGGLASTFFSNTHNGEWKLYINGLLVATETGSMGWHNGRSAAAIGGASGSVQPDDPGGNQGSDIVTASIQTTVGGSGLITDTWFGSFDGDIALVRAYDGVMSDDDVWNRWIEVTTPEPASMMLLALGSTLLISRRRQA